MIGGEQRAAGTAVMRRWDCLRFSGMVAKVGLSCEGCSMFRVPQESVEGRVLSPVH